MKKYRYSIFAVCCAVTLLFFATRDENLSQFFESKFFGHTEAPVAGWTMYPAYKSGNWRLNLVPGSANVAETESSGSVGYNTGGQLPKNQHNQFGEITPHAIQLTQDQPVSTFSIDVDTAAYGFIRATLNSNQQPPRDAVRIEELINYFPYAYPAAGNPQQPFKTTVTVLPCPWNADNKLLHIGIKGYQPAQSSRPRANLVFLIDVSGSMSDPNKLSLVQPALKMLLNHLQDDDSVAIVTYASGLSVPLEPTPVRDKVKIANVIDSLRAEGSTSGEAGLQKAYQLAQRNFDPNGINRVILATDGDFNVGISDPRELKSFIERQRASGISLSVLGFGMGNYNDDIMQTLAQSGNGNAAYIDTLNEARKVLAEQVNATLLTIAKDVKIQMEFNPKQIAEYRLLGYENRILNRADFNNDRVDAGEIGAGHSVTAIYEITPVGSKGRMIDKPRYQSSQDVPTDNAAIAGEYAQLKIRYKLPDSDVSQLLTTVIDQHQELDEWQKATEDTRFSIAVAAFGQLLRGDPVGKSFSYDQTINLAQAARGDDPYGYRAEFISLIRLAQALPAIAQTSFNGVDQDNIH